MNPDKGSPPRVRNSHMPQVLPHAGSRRFRFPFPAVILFNLFSSHHRCRSLIRSSGLYRRFAISFAEKSSFCMSRPISDMTAEWGDAVATRRGEERRERERRVITCIPFSTLSPDANHMLVVCHRCGRPAGPASHHQLHVAIREPFLGSQLR